MSTIINKEVLKDIRYHLESAYPYEACGFLLGSDNQRVRHITAFLVAENKSLENHRRRFVIDPKDYLEAERYADDHHLQLLGIYHAHPDHPAVPSIHDLEFAQPYFSYFIHSIENGKMTTTRSYRLVNGEFLEEKFTIHQQIKSI
ncbi:MAG TPA: M67 family metallopeptidase [Saprospiraceae bacterium]|nr:M67 family metallopeptidase [Saprospiraceae bacterium]